jgi:hypothetical protein
VFDSDTMDILDGSWEEICGRGDGILDEEKEANREAFDIPHDSVDTGVGGPYLKMESVQRPGRSLGRGGRGGQGCSRRRVTKRKPGKARAYL